jgi:hypothetical protein
VIDRRRTFTTAFAVAACGVLGIAAPAAAQQPGAPSAYDQYVESVPNPRGDKPSHETQPGEGRQLSAPVEAELQALGGAGAATASLAETTGPRGVPDKGGDRGSDGGLGGALGQILSPSAAGIGWILPLILLAVLIAGIAYALSRRMREDDVSG